MKPTHEIALHKMHDLLWFADPALCVNRCILPQIGCNSVSLCNQVHSHFEKNFSHEANRQGVSRCRFSQGGKLLTEGIMTMTPIRPYTPTTDTTQTLPPDERATAFMSRLLSRVAQQDAAQAAQWQAQRASVRRLRPLPPGRPSWLIEAAMKPPAPKTRRARWVLQPGQKVVTP